jgi:phospholipase C
MTGVSRRTLITSGAAVAGAIAAGSMVPGAAEAATTGSQSAGTSAGHQHNSIKDVKHVVILMQENRSFDHYYGTLADVRGFADKQALAYPDGTNIFAQPDPNRANKTLLPFRMDTTQYDAQEAGDLDHSWGGTHAAWNAGAWNRWVTTKGEETMGYFTRADIPWQYALADAYTICDGYFCSIQGPTTPNRLFLWTGTNDPSGTAGGPAISNPDDYLPVYNWTTYPERLQQAGVSWQVYANTEIGEGDWLGDYGDNPLWLFQSYHDAQASTDPGVHELADRGSVTPWQPDAGQGHAVDHLLERFIADCAAGTLPTVSWIVSSYRYSEHPQARPVDGAAYTEGVLKALWQNPELWESTVVLIDFDENDGFFDHVLPPFPAPGTAGEYVDGLPVGLGPRVPMMVVSPWSHGGWINSQVFDHTSVIRFLEKVTGVQEPNISAWRRSICGDLTSCFDFTSFNPHVPNLPDITALVAAADAQESLPRLPAPSPGTQPGPTQEPGARKHRSLPYQPGGNIAIDRATGIVTITVTNGGSAAISANVFANNVQPLTASAVVAKRGTDGHYVFDTTATAGAYDVSVHGPNGFLRGFAGSVIPSATHDVAVPTVTAEIAGQTLRIKAGNTGKSSVRFTLTSNDYVHRTRTEHVAGGGHTEVSWASHDGWYDVTVTASSPAGFSYRFAGRIES